MIGYSSNAIIPIEKNSALCSKFRNDETDSRMIRSHDGPGASINDSPLERWHPAERALVQRQPQTILYVRCSQLPLASVHGSGVQSLLWVAEANKVLYHSRDISTLKTLDITVADFSSEEGILGKSLFDLSNPCVSATL